MTKTARVVRLHRMRCSHAQIAEMVESTPRAVAVMLCQHRARQKRLAEKIAAENQRSAQP